MYSFCYKHPTREHLGYTFHCTRNSIFYCYESAYYILYS